MINKRSPWKIPYIFPLFTHLHHKKRRIIKTRVRNSIIPKRFLAKTVHIYNGRQYIPIIIKRGMIGHKLGELSITKLLGYRIKKSKKKKKHKRKK